MLRFVKWLLAAPFILAFLAFATINRQYVQIKFNPLDGGDVPDFSIGAPLFVVLIGSIMAGVALGGVATWLGQGKYRRAARQNRADADRWRSQAAPPHAVAPRGPIARD